MFFGIEVGFGLGDNVKSDGQANLADLIESGEKVDAFDGAIFRRVEVPGDLLIFIGVGFLFDGVIKDENALVAFDLAQQGLDESP